METRKITVVSSRTQKRYTVESAATTLGELKSDLHSANIEYDGMTFMEGLTKTEMKSDDSRLPTDVPYKGATTNELVFMLSTTDKKIRSGANRARSEVFADIKRLRLEEVVKTRLGKNFTQCSTPSLEEIIAAAAPVSTAAVPVTASDSTPSEPVETSKAVAAISALVQILCDTCVISDEDGDKVREVLGNASSSTSFAPKADTPYSDNEIDAMFRGM